MTPHTHTLQTMTYRELVELEDSLPRSLTSVHITRPRMSKHASAADARKAREMQVFNFFKKKFHFL